MGRRRAAKVLRCRYCSSDDVLWALDERERRWLLLDADPVPWGNVRLRRPLGADAPLPPDLLVSVDRELAQASPVCERYTKHAATCSALVRQRVERVG